MAFNLSQNFLNDLSSYAFSRLGTKAKVYYQDGTITSKTFEVRSLIDNKLNIAFTIDETKIGTITKVEVLDVDDNVLFADDTHEVKDFDRFYKKKYQIEIKAVI